MVFKWAHEVKMKSTSIEDDPYSGINQSAITPDIVEKITIQCWINSNWYDDSANWDNCRHQTWTCISHFAMCKLNLYIHTYIFQSWYVRNIVQDNCCMCYCSRAQKQIYEKCLEHCKPLFRMCRFSKHSLYVVNFHWC